jgi:hypothetical protein
VSVSCSSSCQIIWFRCQRLPPPPPRDRPPPPPPRLAPEERMLDDPRLLLARALLPLKPS